MNTLDKINFINHGTTHQDMQKIRGTFAHEGRTYRITLKFSKDLSQEKIEKVFREAAQDQIAALAGHKFKGSVKNNALEINQRRAKKEYVKLSETSHEYKTISPIFNACFNRQVPKPGFSTAAKVAAGVGAVATALAAVAVASRTNKPGSSSQDLRVVVRPANLKVTGIMNGGNYCYFNSSLQALLNSSSFRELLKKELKKKETESQEAFDARLAVQKDLIALANDLDAGNVTEATKKRESILANLIKANVQIEINEENNTRQHDASAVVRGLLEILEDEFILETTRRGNSDNTTIDKSTQSKPDQMIMLTINKNSAIENIIKEYADETIQDENACVNGIRYPSVQVENRIKDSPKMISLQFKRAGSEGGVNSDLITFPTNGIVEMSSLMKEGGNSKYKIKSIIVHAGNSSKSGHYISYIQRDNQWYVCDDAKVYTEAEYLKLNPERRKEKACLVVLEKLEV